MILLSNCLLNSNIKIIQGGVLCRQIMPFLTSGLVLENRRGSEKDERAGQVRVSV